MTARTPNQPRNQPRNNPSINTESRSTSKDIIDVINKLDNLQDYNIRTLVQHAADFGPFLRNQRLETNQIRKFLDAINRLKAQLAQGDAEESAPKDDETSHPKAAAGIGDGHDAEESAPKDDEMLSAEIETDIVLLKPKLAYAAARQNAAKPLSDVMSAAIDKVHNLKDFERLVQLIESIIAYHKAEGGR
jgi:CRISPR-associated protein Csm2